MPRPRFQFRLRTLFVVVTALCVLLAQWPLVVWVPPHVVDKPGGGDLIRPTMIAGYHFVPTRVVMVGLIEGAALMGWIFVRLIRATRDGS